MILQGDSENGELFVLRDGFPRLIAGRCHECGCHFFPFFAQLHRPNCSGGPVRETELGNVGQLVSYTIQRFPPPEPYPRQEPYRPFAIGAVVLPEGLQVLGQITGCGLEEIKIGNEMELVTGTLGKDADGEENVTWMFRPLFRTAGNSTEE